MLKKQVIIAGLIVSQAMMGGIFDIVEGAGETAFSPVVGLSPEHSFRYHAGEGLGKIGQGTTDIMRSPLTLGTSGNAYDDTANDYDEEIEAEMLQAD